LRGRNNFVKGPQLGARGGAVDGEFRIRNLDERSGGGAGAYEARDFAIFVEKIEERKGNVVRIQSDGRERGVTRGLNRLFDKSFG
jgi:hypothetical protein